MSGRAGPGHPVSSHPRTPSFRSHSSGGRRQGKPRASFPAPCTTPPTPHPQAPAARIPADTCAGGGPAAPPASVNMSIVPGSPPCRPAPSLCPAGLMGAPPFPPCPIWTLRPPWGPGKFQALTARMPQREKGGVSLRVRLPEKQENPARAVVREAGVTAPKQIREVGDRREPRATREAVRWARQAGRAPGGCSEASLGTDATLRAVYLEDRALHLTTPAALPNHLPESTCPAPNRAH